MLKGPTKNKAVLFKIMKTKEKVQVEFAKSQNSQWIKWTKAGNQKTKQIIYVKGFKLSTLRIALNYEQV